ncbi:protein-L-isoaspartate(D-aspartate) O-methyltransferase, partial [Endothiovibrio diazotrophicus]
MTGQRARDRLVERLKQEGIQDHRVLEAIRYTPRHLFMDEAMATRAYEDSALPIGYGQTISQPWVVARMTEALIADGIPPKVLEVGTGSGYQAAILAALATEREPIAVYSVERITQLYQRVRDLFWELRMRNVRTRHADGGWGWPEEAPFDAIIVTCAPERVPEALLEQLAVGGRLVIPVGAGRSQQLLLIYRTEEGYEQHFLDQVTFVPLLGGA